MKKISNFILSHCDFNFYATTWIGVIVAILGIFGIVYLPEEYGYENGLLENIQMIVLLIGFILALMVKSNKKFFRFVALVITIIALREVNCGRTLFFAIPNQVNAYYSWKDIKYGYLAHPIYGAYMAVCGLYFLKNKLFITLWNMIKNIKFPIWDLSLMILGMGFGLYAEKAMHNFVFEEVAELIFYVALTSIIYLYGYNKNFRLEK